MQSKNKTFVQMMKDNAFYIALGVGLLAILAVVAVYTMGQNGITVSEHELDLNQASDYSAVTTEASTQKKTMEKTTDVSAATGKKTNEKTETSEKEEDKTEWNTIAAERTMTENEQSEEITNDASNEKKSVPVISDTGELDFTSEKTIGWPVNGEVILPYSMETTVYYKTLDQYRVNPGILIAAGNGTTVKNAYLGKVTKVTSDNTYGNMVTLYIGNNYSMVYGQLDTIYVKEGDYVKAGESIGTIGNPTDIFKEEGGHLFFQILENDQPVDPMLFIS